MGLNNKNLRTQYQESIDEHRKNNQLVFRLTRNDIQDYVNQIIKKKNPNINNIFVNHFVNSYISYHCKKIEIINTL